MLVKCIYSRINLSTVKIEDFFYGTKYTWLEQSDGRRKCLSCPDTKTVFCTLNSFRPVDFFFHEVFVTKLCFFRFIII